MGLLRSLFGPSQAEIWQQLSNEIAATYVDGGFWNGAKVVARHGQWTITLDTYAVSTGKSVVHFTRLRAPYVNQDGFRFTIYRKGWFTDFGKWLGMQDVEVGQRPLDDEFVIQGTDEKKLQALFDNQRIRELVQLQPDLNLAVKDDEGWFGATFPQGVDELYFRVGGVVKDIDRLKHLYELFAEMLEHLCVIGSAYENDPRVIL